MTYKDGSEEHFVLISKDVGATWSIDTSLFGNGDYAVFMPQTGSALETVWLNPDNTKAEPDASGATEYYKLNLDAAYLISHDGNVQSQIACHC